MSIPIDIFYLQNTPDIEETDQEFINTTNLVLQGDAGTDQLAVAIYNKETNELIAWTTYALPYPKWDNVNQHTYYEYLVFLLSQILMYVLYPSKDNNIITYQWRNDNRAALAWSLKNACASRSSQKACMIITWLQVVSKILMLKPEFISGIEMGDVDSASRNKWQSSLTPDKYINIQDDVIINQIFEITSPYITTNYLADQHVIFLEIHNLISQLKQYNF
jgi:hypothetical protein